MRIRCLLCFGRVQRDGCSSNLDVILDCTCHHCRRLSALRWRLHSAAAAATISRFLHRPLPQLPPRWRAFVYETSSSATSLTSTKRRKTSSKCVLSSVCMRRGLHTGRCHTMYAGENAETRSMHVNGERD